MNPRASFAYGLRFPITRCVLFLRPLVWFHRVFNLI